MNEKPKPEPEDFLGPTLTSKLDYIEKGIAKLEGIITVRTGGNINLSIPPEALEILHEVLTLGARKGKDKWWERDPAAEHANHAYIHIEKWGAGLGEHHINHAFARLMMAAVIQRRKEENDTKNRQ